MRMRVRGMYICNGELSVRMNVKLYTGVNIYLVCV